MADVEVREATDEEALHIAIHNLQRALNDEDHRGSYVDTARAWIKHL